MQFDWWTFAFQMVNVLILTWLLGRFLFRPVAEIIARRQKETCRAMEAAEESQRQASLVEAKALADRQSIAAERLSVMDAARKEAEALRLSLLEKARRDADAVVLSVRSEADREVEEERTARQKRAVELAVVIAQRLLDNLPGDGRIAGYADRLRTALAVLSHEERKAFEADAGTLRLQAARALTSEEKDEATDACLTAFPAAIAPAVDVNRDLIAGLELCGRHSIVHNSLRHDLSRVSEALLARADV